MTNAEEIRKRLNIIEAEMAGGRRDINDYDWCIAQLRASLLREEILKSRASQFESTLTETMRVRDEALEEKERTNEVYMMNRHALEDLKKERDIAENEASKLRIQLNELKRKNEFDNTAYDELRFFYDEKLKLIQTLEIKLRIAHDSQLRTYDGLAQKADAYDDMKVERDGARAALEDRDKMHEEHIKKYEAVRLLLTSERDEYREAMKRISIYWTDYELGERTSEAQIAHEVLIKYEP